MAAALKEVLFFLMEIVISLKTRKLEPQSMSSVKFRPM